MTGMGKTTLAKNLYNHPRVANHFHAHGCCPVFQEYKKRELLLKILSNIRVPSDNICQMDDEDLALQLYQQLKRGAYLIVMDMVHHRGSQSRRGLDCSTSIAAYRLNIG